MQAEILLLLAAADEREDDWLRARPAPGKLFIVGDPKQAIYRFRGTDVGTYWLVCRLIAAADGRVLQLTTSYRSVPPIQKFVNAAFAAEMTADERTLQAGYVPLGEKRPPEPGQPALVALPVPAPYGRSSWGQPRVSGWAIEKSLPDAVGAFIAWLVEESGWTVAERQADGGERRVNVAPRHVAVLFRRFASFGEDVTRRYVDAIEARGHAAPARRRHAPSTTARRWRRSARRSPPIEWPDDELSVFATLKGSLFAIDDEALLEFRHRFGAFHPFRVPLELGGNSGEKFALTGESIAPLMPIADALRALQRLHRGRNARPVADTLGRLLALTRAHVGFILRPAGEQALANVMHVAELARQYEAGGGISFRGFIDELRQAAAASDAAEAPIRRGGERRRPPDDRPQGEGAGVSRRDPRRSRRAGSAAIRRAAISTPRADSARSRSAAGRRASCTTTRSTKSTRDRAEGVRLAYVAATRARDLLVVPALGDEPWSGGWLEPLNRALYPPAEARRAPRKARNCPPFKSKDSVLERQDNDSARDATVAPGLHAFAEGYEVVWWDPRALSLGARPSFGVRREDLIVKDVPRQVVDDGRERYEAWRAARADARAAGARASLAVETVRERAERDAGPAVACELVDLTAQAADAPRPGGAAFGLLVHAVLAAMPLDADARVVAAAAAVEGRILGAAEEDVAAAVAVAVRVLASPLLGRARASDARGGCRRESPVTCPMPGGTLVEGIVDLAFEENGAWIVVDYKTDRELTYEGEARYRRQIALYATAIAQATGCPASGVLVRV